LESCRRRWEGNEGQGEEVEGHVDLDVIDGRQDELEGRLRQRYARDQAKEIDDWCGRQKWQNATLVRLV
jgi:hypothetical protein